MRKIRVLVVDDAVVVRRIVTDVLAHDPEIEVAGIAANGKIALARIPQVNPDILTLDVEMPEMDGLTTLKELRKTYPALPVIMFSTLTARGAATTLDALTYGASDYVTKPANVGSVSQAIQEIRENLIPKIKALCSAGQAQNAHPPACFAPKPTAAPAPQPAQASTQLAAAKQTPKSFATTARPKGAVEIVAIGVSTGGPNALAVVMPQIPANFPVPIVIVQHMPPLFTRLLAERLATQSSIPVVEGAAGMLLEPGTAYIAPGDYHMVLERAGPQAKITTTKAPPENSCRPAVDVLFRSVVKVYGAKTLGVILTGMGQDGLRGCEYIAEAGGRVLAQDEKTSVVWGMPGFVAKAGLAQSVLPLDAIGLEIARIVKAANPAETSTAIAGMPKR